MNKVMKYFLYGNHDKKIFNTYKNIINENNFKRMQLVCIGELIFNLVVFVAITLTTFDIMSSGSFVYLFNVFLSIIYFIISKFWLKDNMKYATIFFYIYIIISLLSYEHLGITYNETYNATTLCTMFLVYSMLITDKPYRFSIIIFILSLTATAHSFNVKTYDVAVIDCFNFSVACFASIIISYYEFNTRLQTRIYQSNVENERDTDYLTNLKNRIYTESGINEYLKNSNKLNAMMLIDLDNFKKVNDTYGHLKGDKLLKKVANILKNNFRNTDYISRIGGDEFLVFIPDIKSKKTIESKGKKIIEKICKIELSEVKVGDSIGIAYSDKSTDYHTLFTNADSSMYKAKENGKNCICIYKSENKE